MKRALFLFFLLSVNLIFSQNEYAFTLENENGEVTVKDIEINFSDVNPKTTEKLLDSDTKFMPLSDQLLKEQSILDNYGSQIINNL